MSITAERKQELIGEYATKKGVQVPPKFKSPYCERITNLRS